MNILSLSVQSCHYQFINCTTCAPVYIYAEHCRRLIDFCPSWHLRIKQIPVPCPAMTTHNDVTTDNAQHRSVPIDTFLDTDFAKRAKKLTEVDTNSEKCTIIFCPTHLKTYSLHYDHTLLAMMPVLC